MVVAKIARLPKWRELRLCEKITFSDLFDNFFFENSREFLGMCITEILAMRQ